MPVRVRLTFPVAMSHFASLGFADATGMPDLDRLVPAMLTGERTVVDDGTYVRWSPGNAAELWLQLDPLGEIIGVNPHFAGEGRMKVGLVELVRRPTESALDGAFHAWCEPEREQEPESGQYPFVFDAPDARVHVSLALPRIATVQLAAFAHELTAYESEAAFQAADTKYAAQSFVPAGLFTDGQQARGPTAHAFFAGRVLRVERLTNAFTTFEFMWALVETFGGVIDVVAEPSMVRGALRRGGIVQGTFWLSGRITSADP